MEALDEIVSLKSFHMNKHVEYGLVGGIEDWCYEHLNTAFLQ